ncbi:MAG: metalloregulator ArsR/SmtB family transcription factor [Alphaproteobacteria bacterium]|nr:metalloregulator ArsR/SmtB family transcription factor [Alphaproteobacteria bacterium]MCB9928566.1 metalloregulator ArsR/SmtB family transcription factor [Alphaproteobacteria bacterium]
MQSLIESLKAIAEPTRLRIVSLCASGELAVSEIAQILGQSQPRVSRHLKILADVGLLTPMREGNWSFYRLERIDNPLAAAVLELIPADDPVIVLDQARLSDVRRRRQAEADAYFGTHAESWDAIRQLHIDAAEVDRQVLAQVPAGVFETLLDIGTGTGEVLRLLAPRVQYAIGLDISREMLAVARDRVARADLQHVSLRLGDMYALPLADASVDLVVVHLVLHFADTPERAVAEAARVLRPGGRLIVVDFARHSVEDLRSRHAHRRLGFDDEEVRTWFDGCGLKLVREEALPGDPLTVRLWTADHTVAGESLINRARIAGSPWL